VSVLEVRDLTVEFGQRGGSKLRAVDGLSFALREGQTLALVGESGSGKSTVVRALAQLVKRTSGQILLDGAPQAGAARHCAATGTGSSWCSRIRSPRSTRCTPSGTT